ncbi:ATP-binding cassette domain-containing protein [Piscibacillus salipiscarius]|uniref:ATP-binding cassette domain-containing protein n=1 Tax=Piscibacillus salipiscarius TaxID=299480 RepID=UPI002436E906|nr:ATP-binding cassette domain-containing protein [Piscibacillus salipiscarius]
MSKVIIHANELTKRYGSHIAVNHINLEVYEGEVFGIIGPNGAGKTTFIEMITAFRKPDNGSAQVIGLDSQNDFLSTTGKIGVQLQQASLYEKLKVKEVLKLFCFLLQEESPYRRVGFYVEIGRVLE